VTSVFPVMRTNEKVPVLEREAERKKKGLSSAKWIGTELSETDRQNDPKAQGPCIDLLADKACSAGLGQLERLNSGRKEFYWRRAARMFTMRSIGKITARIGASKNSRKGRQRSDTIFPDDTRLLL